MNSLAFLSTHFDSIRAQRGRRQAMTLAALSVLAIAVSPLAHADLGGAPQLPASAQLSATAVRSFQARTGTTALAAVTSTAASTASTYTVRQSTLADGTVEREYLNVDQTVFAAAFAGRFIPDLQSLLGSNAFTQYASARAAEHESDIANGAQRSRGTPVNVQTDNMVVQITGHPGAFSGRAWLPALVPTGMDTADIK
ncbi:DUF2844 domain-containing protein [Robbsia sp. KACC 23696]|uniref:DUF2844 domain-containing protein n=1 Tax=Robbsia sp. KACC 23696 TaxID=3149231 RepID=UPI00325ADEA9